MRILIVDDEALIRESLERTFRDIVQFEVDSASNGMAALELVRQHNYDAVIVDIMMPQLNGIEFLKELNSLGSSAVKVILSGYNKFDFAQKAIELGVSEFLLKPLPRQSVIELSERLKAAIAKKRDAIVEISELKMQIEKSKPLLLERFLEEIVLIGGCQSDYSQQMRYFGLRLIGDRFQVAILNYCHSPAQEAPNESDLQALGLSLLRIAKDHADATVQIMGFRTLQNCVVLIFCFAKPDLPTLSVVMQKLSAIIDYAAEYHAIPMYGGLGRHVSGIRGIHTSYLQAQSAARYNSLVTCTSFISINDIEENTDSRISEIGYDAMLSQIKLCLKDEVTAGIRDFFNHPDGSGLGLEAIQFFAIKTLMACMEALSELGLAFIPDIDAMFSLIRDGAGHGKPGGILPDLIALAENTMQKITEARKAKNSYWVDRAQKYINKHFCEDISVKDVADALTVSKNYLGQQFKEQTGLSISNYTNNLRIKRAMELLSTSHLKIYEVGNAIGFDDQHYFSTIFKRYTSVSPSEYRELVK